MNDVVNPLTPPAPDFTPPSSDMEISQEAREFAQAPAVGEHGVARAPTDAEVVARLQQARELIGDKFWQPKAPPPPTAAEKAEADRLAMIGVAPGAQPSAYTLPALPPGTQPDTGDRIRGAMAALELSGPYGNTIAERVVFTGQHIGRLSETERATYQAQQERNIAEFAERRGWNLPEVKANVERMLSERKIDPSVGALAMFDSMAFLYLAMHVDNLKAVKR